MAQIEEIVGLCTNPQCQKAVFSATLPAKAEQTVLNMLKEPIRVVVGLKCVQHLCGDFVLILGSKGHAVA